MNEIARLVRAVRRTVRVRERTLLVGSVLYVCDTCQMQMRVGLARGVAPPDFPAPEAIDMVPPPPEAPCRFCSNGRYQIVRDSYEERIEGLSMSQPYLRVPSRRATALLAGAGRFEAQLVMPDDSL